MGEWRVGAPSCVTRNPTTHSLPALRRVGLALCSRARAGCCRHAERAGTGGSGGVGRRPAGSLGGAGMAAPRGSSGSGGSISGTPAVRLARGAWRERRASLAGTAGSGGEAGGVAGSAAGTRRRRVGRRRGQRHGRQRRRRPRRRRAARRRAATGMNFPFPQNRQSARCVYPDRLHQRRRGRRLQQVEDRHGHRRDGAGGFRRVQRTQTRLRRARAGWRWSRRSPRGSATGCSSRST